jgi:hypothetical protein
MKLKGGSEVWPKFFKKPKTAVSNLLKNAVPAYFFLTYLKS